MFLPWFNCLEEIFFRIGQKVAKTYIFVKISFMEQRLCDHEILFSTYIKTTISIDQCVRSAVDRSCDA